ncbi:DNA cytosine methyltransferase [Streptomyces sp. MBT53]|uniref:DNA cytosine methyltransferase n=1 Tax=Streptomyces sp. MBT53 TaxID=1488384 RepID=UPI001912650E|nr:DNA (cytosine-5-)-methyltransferase [Streptomyces sp. MBT53]MBK6019258.1 DNA (cytosine-5-)-methyltransferase [Streptomyces sp. MBT53]
MTRTNEPKGSVEQADEPNEPEFTSIEICAGAGGQAIGLHQAGFGHLALVEIDPHAAATLEKNVASHPKWVWEKGNCDVLPPTDVNDFDQDEHLVKSAEVLQRRGLDLLAGGVPCPPFSHAGKQLGKDDERDLFPRMLALVEELKPRAVMIENVRGIMDPKFDDYRDLIQAKLQSGWYRGDDGQMVWDDGMGYTVGEWDILEASDFGVPQLRPRAILVAFRNDILKDVKYEWPAATHQDHVSVAEALEESMRARYEPYFTGGKAEVARKKFDTWLDAAQKRHRVLAEKGGGIAPTLVGGSKKHGGADLGPSRAKAAWGQLGVNGLGVANDPDTCRTRETEGRDLFGENGPMLTVQQAAIIQGFPPEWQFSGGKTAQYRQVGNAFPPPVARAVGKSIADVLRAARERDNKKT